MSDIVKREFEVLAVDGSNYLTWATDIEIKLDGMSVEIIPLSSLKLERMKTQNLIKQECCIFYDTISTRHEV
jgi:hypothetical protein